MQSHDIQIPLEPAEPDGPCWLGKATILGQKGQVGIAELGQVDPEAVRWVQEFDAVYFHALGDGGVLKAVRAATDEDYRALRVPLWIQSEEVPECCGRPMAFIGQLDDDAIWAEPPPGAKMWWHDTASFYVFTCPECLSVQAVGQQY